MARHVSREFIDHYHSTASIEPRPSAPPTVDTLNDMEPSEQQRVLQERFESMTMDGEDEASVIVDSSPSGLKLATIDAVLESCSQTALDAAVMDRAYDTAMSRLGNDDRGIFQGRIGLGHVYLWMVPRDGGAAAGSAAAAAAAAGGGPEQAINNHGYLLYAGESNRSIHIRDNEHDKYLANPALNGAQSAHKLCDELCMLQGRELANSRKVNPRY